MNASAPAKTLGPDASLDRPVESKPVIMRVDNIAPEEERRQIYEFLAGPGWNFGWKSSSKTDVYSFWHKHFVGTYSPEEASREEDGRRRDLAPELEETYPLLFALWKRLQETILKGHSLVRCYANGIPYGSDGTLHTDSSSSRSFTTVYYPHDAWSPNWGGETVLFNREVTDVIGAIFPKPNRAAMFQGNVPHVARGVSRLCPVMRITLMFKSEIPS